MSWRDSFVALDTETTGFGPKARIIEVAAVVFENRVPVREWSSLLLPEDVDWGSEKVAQALSVNKLTREQLQGKPTFAQVLPDLLVELSHDVLVAHNAEFDLAMLNQELQRLNRPVLSPQLLVCTRDLAFRFNWTNDGNKLDQAASRYGIAFEDAHRAAVDARTCGAILGAILEKHPLPTEVGPMAELCRAANAAWKAKRRW
jgi:DNA polymerase-3 subunit epsilon